MTTYQALGVSTLLLYSTSCPTHTCLDLIQDFIRNPHISLYPLDITLFSQKDKHYITDGQSIKTCTDLSRAKSITFPDTVPWIPLSLSLLWMGTVSATSVAGSQEQGMALFLHNPFHTPTMPHSTLHTLAQSMLQHTSCFRHWSWPQQSKTQFSKNKGKKKKKRFDHLSIDKNVTV